MMLQFDVILPDALSSKPWLRCLSEEAEISPVEGSVIVELFFLA